ncbi:MULTISPECIES: hypothetical protein [Thermoanaerobacter]|uniref:Polymerase beta nucleotidyltransferase domain-containing protein n=1 Tax=Thermoanaerobacter italicus (strain DSM 9252 / Ab9) TaxID=580331 RepID=D3T6Z7_THEIA|nr:hypothetical protein [Thermoanaerobacter italicus]ADD01729.1 conserved hypothetical protein [Thermoanaerobacter italicus Ab9]
MYSVSEKLTNICKKYNIALVYLFGSQKENALKLLKEEKVVIDDPLTDIDVGIVFLENIEFMKDRYKIYANFKYVYDKYNEEVLEKY